MKYLAFSGSTRTDSVNQRTVDVMAQCLSSLGAEITAINLTHLDVPIYDGDLEKKHGLPVGIEQLQKEIHEHDALLIGCPEYNGYMTPLLLNTIDWATRSTKGSADLTAFRDRPVQIVRASPGGMGGMRATNQLKTMLSGIGCLVFPDAFSVSGANSAFNEDGTLVDEKLQQRANAVAQRFDAFTKRNLS